MARRLDPAVFDREVRVLLAAARWSAADIEQVLETTARIDLADADSWLREWTAAGGEARAAAQRSDRPDAYAHAACYYGAALALIGESDGLVGESALWARQRECWDRAVVALGGQPVVIPYEETTLPGFFISAGDGRRPVIVVDSGGRMVTSQAWVHVGAAARARGYHWLTFEGPGRQAALRRGLVLRPDWEAVVAPVADVLSLRPDVDAGRMAIVGLEMGGFGVARALVAERRFAAALLVPGILDASRPWTDRLPDGARMALLDKNAALFDRELQLASLFAPEIESQLRRHGRWFGGDGGTLYDLYRQISTYRLGDELQTIDTPTTVCEPLDAGCWAGQAADLARGLGSPGTLVRGRRAEEAIMAWLDAVF